MAIAYVASAKGTGTSASVTSASIDTTSANLIVVSIANYAAVTVDGTLTDSKSNTWTALTGQTSPTFPVRNRLFYCVSPTVGSGHTFTYAGTDTYPGISVAAFSGVDTASPLISQNGSALNPATSIQPGSVTPTSDGALIITGLGNGAVNTMSVNSGFTIAQSQVWTSGSTESSSLAYKIQTIATAENPTWSWSSSTQASSTIAAFKAAVSGGGGGSAYPNGFTYRKSVNIDYTKVSGTSQTNFPVLIDVTLPAAHVTSAQGYDVMLTDSSGVALDFELDNYNSGTGQWKGWVRVPTLSGTVATILYVYYGKSSVTTDQSTTGVWDSNYQTVYHLDDMADSTANGRILTDGGTASTAGKIGDARSFDATTTSYLTGTDIAFGGTSPITISAWINPSTLSGNRDIVAQGTEVVLRQVNTGIEWILNSFTGASDRIIAGSLLTAGSWTYVTASYSSTNGLRLFTNGVLQNSGTPTGSYANVTFPFRIGVLGTGTELFLGTIDEVRISSVERSSGWITTEYNNQSNPSAFYTPGTEEAAPSSSAGKIKVYTGVSFVAKPVKVWNGSAWVTKPLKRYNGTSWVTTNY